MPYHQILGPASLAQAKRYYCEHEHGTRDGLCEACQVALAEAIERNYALARAAATRPSTRPTLRGVWGRLRR